MPNAMRCAGAGKGFTLIELMVAVAIVAVLAAIVYPSYQDHLLKSRRAEGKTALLKALQLQERSYTSNGTYATDMGPMFGLGTGVVPRSGEDPTQGNYDLSAAADANNGNDLRQGVVVTATPRAGVFSDPYCGPLTISSVGTRGFGPSPNGKGTQNLCWER